MRKKPLLPTGRARVCVLTATELLIDHKTGCIRILQRLTWPIMEIRGWVTRLKRKRRKIYHLFFSGVYLSVAFSFFDESAFSLNGNS